MKIYISHADADENVARELARTLRSENIEVTYPSENLFPGDNWALEMGKSLEKSDTMVVLLSPAAAKSEWVKREVGFALGNPNYEWRLVPVNLKPGRDIPWVSTNLPPIAWTDDIQSNVKKITERIRHPIKRFRRVAAAKAA